MIANPRRKNMSNISNKQKVTAIAAIGAAAVFGMLSFGSSAQAAKYSYNCNLLNAAFGLSCCDRMMGSRLIDTNANCHENKKIVQKRRLRRPHVPPPIILVKRPILYGITREGGGDNGGGNVGGDGGGNKGKDPSGLR
jgi:hypothetical protein